MTCFLVDAPAEGLIAQPMQRMMGCQGPRHYNIFYRDLRVHESQILGDRGKGLDIALGMLHLSRVSIAACGVGTAQRMLDLAVDYAKRRHTFGKPVASRQAIQGNVAQMATEISRPPALPACGLDVRPGPRHRHRSRRPRSLRADGGAGGGDGACIHGGVGFTQAYPWSATSRLPQLPLRGGHRGDPEATHRPEPAVGEGGGWWRRDTFTPTSLPDWRALAAFYGACLDAGRCPPERDYRGPLLDACTGLSGAHFRGASASPVTATPDPRSRSFSTTRWLLVARRQNNRIGLHIAFAVDDVQAAVECVRAERRWSIGRCGHAGYRRGGLSRWSTLRILRGMLSNFRRGSSDWTWLRR